VSGPSFESWEAQVPSEGFADRATVAVLRDRAHASRRPQRRAWVVLAVAACLLTAGAAWAWAVHPSHMRPDTSASSLDMPPGIERMDPTPSATPKSLGSVPEVAPPPPPPPPVVRARPVPAIDPLPSAAPSSFKVPAPMCICNAFACDCGPE